MPDYSNGKIYTIRSHLVDDIYIGSTCQSLSMRIGGHRREYKRYQHGKCNYVSSFKIVKYEDCYIELLEEFKCDNKQQLEKREGELIRANACVNKFIAGRTQAEYYQDNREALKQYREVNRERSNEKFNCECGGKYTRCGKSHHMKTKKHQRYIEAQQ